MNIKSYLSPRHATSSERTKLSGETPPLLNPWAQDYAAWRSRSLRWSCLAVVLSYVFGIYAGNSFATVKFGLKSPTPLEGWLEMGLSWYLRSLVFGFCLLLLAATWYWYRLSWSSFLVRLAWALTFFGPMPLFLIPFPKVLGQHGLDAAVLASNVIRGLLTLYIPALFALLPALIRAALVLKRFLPELVLPGVLVVLGASFQSLIYFLLISILAQAAPHRNLILGFLFLALSQLVWLVRAKALIKPVGEKEGEKSLRLESNLSRGFTLVGSSMILLVISEAIDFHWLIGQVIDIRWVLSFMAGVLASRTILSVVVVDGLLATLFHIHQSEKAGDASGVAESIGAKIGSLGAAMRHAKPSSADLDGST